MSDVVIRVEDLSKQYRIGGPQGYKTIRESLVEAVQAPFRRLSSIVRGQSSTVSNETIWALKDVSFEVKRGEVVGIIGRNGAGKTTLLKVLSRITEPTEGWAEIHGRVASLLEVGTGFHPELTGRENIYLNGAILGMKRVEIERKFDEIVAFAEIEKFIDTPVKHYSSGMYVRLAFAVAAHLEPEILLVDEVLAVGDYEFQKKCLGKVGEVSREGRTVLLVSHNMSSLLGLCQRAVLLREGKVVADGPATRVVDQYLQSDADCLAERVWDDYHLAPGNDHVRILSVRATQEGIDPDGKFALHKETIVETEYQNFRHGAKLNVSMHLKNHLGTFVMVGANIPCATTSPDPWFGQPYPVGRFHTAFHIPADFLNEGRYTVDVFVISNVSLMEASALDVVSFEMHDVLSRWRRDNPGWAWSGVVRPPLRWQTEYVEPGQ